MSPLYTPCMHLRFKNAESMKFSSRETMDLEAFQNEVNHLVYLYFTAIGVIQRDVDKEDIDSTMESLLNEIKGCKANLDQFLECPGLQPKEESKDKERIIKEANEFMEDGLYLIDMITRGK